MSPPKCDDRNNTGIGQTDGFGITTLHFACIACWRTIENSNSQDRL